MKRNLYFSLFLPVTILLTGAGNRDDEWRNLLDKNLSNWEIYQSYEHANDYNGSVPRNDKGEPIRPVGYNRNFKNVFSVIDDKGEPVLKVSGEIYGCIFTKEEFENYHLRLKVKWGDKKWVPRRDKLKDSGILYHSVGEAGVDYWRSWMLAQEFQVMEGHMGDYWPIANSAIDIRAFISEGTMNSVASEKQRFISFGAGTADRNFCLRSADYESPVGQWTQLELICFGGKSLHIVNGHVVMILNNSRYIKDGKSYPLTKGKIQIQSEAAEALFKDIQLRTLDSFPDNYASYF
jgi:hypothetical protein